MTLVTQNKNKRLDEVAANGQIQAVIIWPRSKAAIDAAAPVNCSYSVFPQALSHSFSDCKHAERGNQTASASLVHRLSALYCFFYSYDMSTQHYWVLPLLDNSAYISRMILPPRDACTIMEDLVG
jgi:hypothetical protein